MKKLSILATVIAITVGVIFFDQLIVFLLSGLIPGSNFTVPATTMLAIMTASVVLIYALRYRQIIYQNSLVLHDDIFRAKQNNKPSESLAKPTLPHRRYQGL